MAKRRGVAVMDAGLLRIFQREIGRQCRYAIIAYDDMGSALGEAASPEGEERFWYSTQAFLVAAGNISKLLWPVKERMSQRGKQLCHSLAVTCSSPLASRHLRNCFEHFDERLQDWAVDHGSDSLLVDSNIAPKQSIVTAGTTRETHLRNFHSDAWVLTFEGDEYDVRQVLAEIRSLAQRVSEVLGQ